MSGRVRWRRQDGTAVTGYRKTERRQSPARPLKDRLEEIARQGQGDHGTRVRVAFILPKALEGLMVPGKMADGVEIIGRGFVRISSWSTEQCWQRAQRFFADVAKGRHGFTLTAVVISTERPDERYTRHLTVVREALVVCGGYVEPIVFEGV